MKIPNPHIETILKSLPDKPGVYQYYDDTGKIIYIGKAKSLRKRVPSYFNKEKFESLPTGQAGGKLAVLVRKIADVRCIVVQSEYDALLLENNLVKEYQPRYNFLLKDDKTFPWICIKKERFPRVFPTRNVIRDGSLYFGPYASVRMMKTLLDLLRQLFPLRNCNLNLSEKNIESGKFKICLEYHIGNCKGPCEGLQTEEDYNNAISQIKDIIKGNINSVKKQLKTLMAVYSESLEYEKAQALKEKTDILERYQSKSTVVNPSIDNVDVFSVVSDEQNGYVNFLKVVHGAVIQSHTIEIKKKLDEPDEELLVLSIAEFRQRFGADAKEIIIPLALDIEIPDVTFTIPQKGDKEQLLELSDRNARYYMANVKKQKSLVDPERHSKRILAQMMKDLRLSEPPVRIECFDNSNIQGAFPVAAMVAFKNAKPDKKEYRHFNIKTVEGPDDFASMEEVIYRRYKRLLEEKLPLPQLIIVDGGKGQLSSALKSLEKLGLRGKLSIIGIAKKLEEIYYPGDSLPLYLDKKSVTLKIIQQLRNEAHRFGIAHHRGKREKALTQSGLMKIDGIGGKTMQVLLRKFKSVAAIKKASPEELQAIVGKAKAEIILKYYQLQASD